MGVRGESAEEQEEELTMNKEMCGPQALALVIKEGNGKGREERVGSCAMEATNHSHTIADVSMGRAGPKATQHRMHSTAQTGGNDQRLLCV